MKNLPPFIMTSDEGSFARRTIQERKPGIIDNILLNNDYTPSIRSELASFKDELKQKAIQPLHEETSDRFIWDQAIKPWLGNKWLEIPWFLAETYFYRRVLEIVRYFQPGPWMNKDPYGILKSNELLTALPEFNKVYASAQVESNIENFQRNCYRALWGNRGDLSHIKVVESDMGQQTERIVLNQAEYAFKFLQQKSKKIAYFFDNIGKELFYDLAFIDFLISTGMAKSITCYVKNQPFFVSDAMPKDFEKSLNALSASGSTTIQNLAKRTRQALRSGIMNLVSHPFFTTSRMYIEMPAVLNSQISAHDLTILKGDVNYRRLFGDRHWEPTTSIEKAGGYFPTSFLSLRTLKAELIVGISQQTLKNIEEQAEEDWLTNGKRGVITFWEKQH